MYIYCQALVPSRHSGTPLPPKLNRLCAQATQIPLPQLTSFDSVVCSFFFVCKNSLEFSNFLPFPCTRTREPLACFFAPNVSQPLVPNPRLHFRATYAAPVAFRFGTQQRTPRAMQPDTVNFLLSEAHSLTRVLPRFMLACRRLFTV